MEYETQKRNEKWQEAVGRQGKARSGYVGEPRRKRTETTLRAEMKAIARVRLKIRGVEQGREANQTDVKD